MNDSIFYNDDELLSVIEDLQNKNKQLKETLLLISRQAGSLIGYSDTAVRILKKCNYNREAEALKDRYMKLAETIGF